MNNNEKEYLTSLLNSINYERNILSIYCGEDKKLVGALIKNCPPADLFFSYTTIYDSILDINLKIQKSFNEALLLSDKLDTEEWNPILAPSDNELNATYYIENAIFRIEIEWDLLAQWYNLKHPNNRDITRIYSNQLFHDCSQGKKGELFAKKVYNYFSEADSISSDYEMWKGNHKYISEYRNKLTHRNSPNITALNNFDITIRPPIIFVLKRAIEEYVQLSLFVSEFLQSILTDFQMLEDLDLESDNNV